MIGDTTPSGDPAHALSDSQASQQGRAADEKQHRLEEQLDPPALRFASRQTRMRGCLIDSLRLGIWERFRRGVALGRLAQLI